MELKTRSQFWRPAFYCFAITKEGSANVRFRILIDSRTYKKLKLQQYSPASSSIRKEKMSQQRR